MRHTVTFVTTMSPAVAGAERSTRVAYVTADNGLPKQNGATERPKPENLKIPRSTSTVAKLRFSRKQSKKWSFRVC